MSDIEFGELPPKGSTRPRGGVLSKAYETLRARPGEWAKIKTYSSQNAATSSAGFLKHNYPGCEVATRGADLWARYVGDPDE